MARTHAFDLRDTRSQMFENDRLAHSIGATRERLKCSLYVLSLGPLSQARSLQGCHLPVCRQWHFTQNPAMSGKVPLVLLYGRRGGRKTLPITCTNPACPVKCHSRKFPRKDTNRDSH